MNTSQLLSVYQECYLHYVKTIYQFHEEYEPSEIANHLGEMAYFANEIAKDSAKAQELGRQYHMQVCDDHMNLMQRMELGEPLDELCPCIAPYIMHRIHDCKQKLHSEEAEDQDIALLIDQLELYHQQWKRHYMNQS